MKETSKKFYSFETDIEHKEMTELLKGKVVSKVTKVNCDEGSVIHFTDGTKLEFGYSGLEGTTSINRKEIDVDGV